MVDESADWTWRQRMRDPRFPAVLALGVAGALLGAAVFGFSWPPILLCVGAAGAAGLVILPQWRDPKRGPRAGAGVLYAGATVTAVLALLVAL